MVFLVYVFVCVCVYFPTFQKYFKIKYVIYETYIIIYNILKFHKFKLFKSHSY
jgi:hypothetical protein